MPTSASEKSVEEEFYSSVPNGYVKGKTKYIIITGSVMSSVGKGTFSSCLGTLLTCHGFNVSPIKFDGYLNYDAGTLNPYRHGEVFVLDDGTECDLDLGTYERQLHKNLTKDNYLTAGKIFKTITDKERSGQYLGRDVLFIPHVTGEIKFFLRNLAMKSNADIVLVEVGGTVGDIENSYFIEAIRELRREEGKENICIVNVTYIIEPRCLGEFKSKPAQFGIRKLMELGLMPDIIVCRSESPISKNIREKVSVYSNVDVDRIYNIYDFRNIYEIPLMLKEVKIDEAVFDILNLEHAHEDIEPAFVEWRKFVDDARKADKQVTIGIVGKYTNVHDSYMSIIKALEHAGPYLGTKVNMKWIESRDLEDKKVKIEDVLRDVNGLIIPGGFGKRGIEGKIDAIRYARENKIPFLGLCLGMQLAIVEFARNVCKLEGANSTEFADTKHPVIDIMPEQIDIINKSKYGGTMRLGAYPAILKEDTLVRKLYDSENISERHRHRYEVNPEYIEILEKNGVIFSGKSPNGILMEFMELKNHPYFVATQAHPEFTSRPLKPNPLFYGFIKSCISS